MNLFKLAWRNVWRNKRRTVATVSAMTLALLIMILYSGIVEGYLYTMERNILDFEVGDIQVFPPGYRKSPSIYERIENEDTLIDTLQQQGFKASARLLGNGLAAAGDSSAGVLIRGIDPASDSEVSFIFKRIFKGSWLDANAPHEVVIGRRLAKTLNVKVGKEIVILAQGTDGSMANEIYTVRGILAGVGDGMDRAGVFVTHGAFRELMVLPEGVHQIIVRRPLDMDLEASKKAVEKSASNRDVKTWKELMPTLASMNESTQSVMMIMFLIVYIAIGSVILNAMLMAVFERVKEFGVLKAIGMGPMSVLRLILLESALQTGVALVFGLLLSLPFNWLLVTYGINLGGDNGISVAGMVLDSHVYSRVSPSTYTGPIVTLLFIVFFAVLYPAVKAAVIEPVKAIYHS